MSKPDPMLALNVTVREFAKLHDLRTLLHEDGELVIPCGPRRATIHLGFGYRRDTWSLCAIDLSARQSSAILAALGDGNFRFAQHGDAEFVIDLPRDAEGPLPILDRHAWSSPRRRRRLSPEAGARAKARLMLLRQARQTPKT